MAKREGLFSQRHIKSRFTTIDRAAAKGELDNWQTSALSCLALIIVLDRFPRNIYRGQPKSFATDSQALAVTNKGEGLLRASSVGGIRNEERGTRNRVLVPSN